MNDRVPGQAEAAQRLALNGFVLDLGAGELLTSDGRLAGLRRQALDVLLVLGERAGQVVPRDDLMRRVWPDVVVGEGSLTQAIAEIRRTLGDQAHQLVRNVARRGYLLAPTGPQEPAGPAPQPGAEPPLDLGARAALPIARLRWAVAGGVIALLVLAASAAWLAQGRRAEA